LKFSGGCVCKHPPHTATHPGSSSTLLLKAGVAGTEFLVNANSQSPHSLIQS
jgi:hypothetical protein